MSSHASPPAATNTSPSSHTPPTLTDANPAITATSPSHLRPPSPAISISSASVVAVDDPNALPVPTRVVSSSSSNAAGPDTDTDADADVEALLPGSPPQVDVVKPTSTASQHAPPSTSAPKKPKSRKQRGPSRSPPPPPRPAPPITVRLQIDLGGPSNYEINIVQLAKQAGQRNATPPPPARLNSDSESSSDEGEHPPNAEPVHHKPVRRRRAREYDLDDPFIDDSDLRIDAPTHFAQTKQQGFYVSSGDVALVRDATPPPAPPSSQHPVTRRPRAGPDGAPRQSLTSLLASATAMAEAPAKVAAPVSMSAAPGTRDSPIALFDDDGDHAMKDDGAEPAAKRIKLEPPPAKSVSSFSTMTIGTSDAGSKAAFGTDGDPKKRKISKEELEKIFHPNVNQALWALKAEVDKADWSNKGKFPPHLKPILQKTATVALQHGDYNDNFFDYLPTIFVYNRYTMMKLTSRLMYGEHRKYLAKRQDDLLEELKQIADEDFPKAQSDYARNSFAWETRQKRRLLANGGTAGDAPSPAAAGEPVVGTPTQAPGEMDVDPPSREGSPGADASDGGEGAGKVREREDKAPVKRFRFTDRIKSRVWGLVHLSNETARITAVINQWDSNISVITEQSLRKSLYTRIINVFPPGWMSSGIISREVSNMKLRLKKELAGQAASIKADE